MYPSPCQIVAVLAGLIFALPGLPWDATQHCELFSGKMAVTLAEMEDRWHGNPRPFPKKVATKSPLIPMQEY